MPALRELPSLACGSALRVIRYAPGSRQGQHVHSSGSLTLILRGVLDEFAGGRHERGAPLSIAVKPPGVPHADEYGADGVLTFQIVLSARRWSELIHPGLGTWQWIHDTPALRPMLRLALASSRGRGDSSNNGLFEEALAALPSTFRHSSRKTPPWLRGVRDALDEQSRTVAGLAEQAGVHPVHLAREFRKAFGLTPSEYRRRARIRRAAISLADGRLSLVDSSQLAGYCDQAHMNREIHTETGLTPGAFRDLIASLL